MINQRPKIAMENDFNKRVYNYVLQLIKFLKKIERNSINYEIVRQVFRSGSSIAANYFESKGALTKKDYKNFFAIALKSSNETIFWLNILLDSNNFSKELEVGCRELIKETEAFAKILASSIITMKKKEKI